MKRISFRRDSLLYQIIKRLIAVVLLFSVLEVGFVVWTYVKNVEELGQRLLESQSEEIAGSIVLKDGAPAYDNTKTVREFVAQPNMAFAVYNRHGKQIFVNGAYNLRPSLMPPITSVSLESRRDEFATGFRLRSIRRFLIEDQPVWVSLVIEGKGFKPFLPVIFAEIIDHVALPLIPLSCLLLAFNIIVVRKTLAPMTKAIEQIDNINPNDVGFRLESPDSPVEVRRLISAMNGALSRIESAIRSLHNFTADTAHELRTPLAVMTMEVDKLPDSPDKQKLKKDIDGMARLVQQMLDMAYADALTIPEEARADLGEIASSVTSHLTPLAVKAGRSITLQITEPATINGHADALGRALRNVIENALAHTPEKTSVDVSVSQSIICIKDHGPGIPETLKDASLDRFRRDNQKPANNSGAGLGLAIARQIVEAHGGKIILDSAPDNGGIVCFDFSGKTEER